MDRGREREIKGEKEREILYRKTGRERGRKKERVPFRVSLRVMACPRGVCIMSVR